MEVSTISSTSDSAHNTKGMTVLDDRPSQYNQQQRSLPGYSLTNPSYKTRAVLKRHRDGRLLSGSGGDLEVVHPLELERSQHTGLPARTTTVTVFGGTDCVKAIEHIPESEHLILLGAQHAALVHGHELFEGSAVSAERILRLPATAIAVNTDRRGKSELLLTFLLEIGIYYYSLNLDSHKTRFECLQCYKCTRPIQSGIVWRDAGVLHLAYYDGFVRVGTIQEDYDDMQLLQRLSATKNDLEMLLEVVCTEIDRLDERETLERTRRIEMLEKLKMLTDKLPKSQNGHDILDDDDELLNAHLEFRELKGNFKSHSMRADRVSNRLQSLRKLLTQALKAVEAHAHLDLAIVELEKEIKQLDLINLEYEGLMNRSCTEAELEQTLYRFEEKKYVVQELIRKARAPEAELILAEWEKQFSSILDSLNGSYDAPKDMRLILSQHIYEHRAEKKDHFTHFLLDASLRDLTLYCMSGLTTLAIYPRKAKRVASISLNACYETSLTAACLMRGVEGVYVADSKGVFPIFFYREKRFFDAGHPINLPALDSISSILMEPNGMILGGATGGLLHLAFDFNQDYEHVIVASSPVCVPFSHGRVQCIAMLPTGDSFIAIHASDTEIVVSERDRDRWHRVTLHVGGAHCMSTTSFSLEHRGTYIVAGSATYVRIKSLIYTEDNLMALSDLGESSVLDEMGKPIEVLNVSLDPTMEYRPMPCKLRYAVGYADKAIRTYVALLTGQQDFSIPEKFIAQIEPLHAVSLMVCFHGRPMGCYAASQKTLQIWNDLDRHQQKKMKSERMELVKMDMPITALERVEGRSCYLLVGFKDGRIQIFEERGRGTGKLESTGFIATRQPDKEDQSITVLHTRVVPTSREDRLFVHFMSGHFIYMYTAFIEAGKLLQSAFVTATPHAISEAVGFQLLPFSPYEFLVYGNGVEVHRLSENDRRKVEAFRDFEF